MASYDALYKVVTVGDNRTGKSSFLTKTTTGKFDPTYEYLETNTVEFQHKLFTLDGKTYKISFVDVSGNDKYKLFTPGYFPGLKALFVFYDVTNRQSFDRVKKWLNEVQAVVKTEFVISIVANKVDLTASRVVSADEGKALAEELKGKYYETSVLTEVGVEDLVADTTNRVNVLFNFDL